MILIKDVTIAGEEEKKSILLHEEKIEKIADFIDPQNCTRVIDGAGLIALPKIIDLNVRIEDDLLTIKNLQKLYQSTTKGGVGKFVLSPRINPLMENQTFLALLSGKLEDSFPNIQLAIKALKDKELTKLNNISTLLKNDINIVQENSDINGNLLRRIYEYSKMHKNLFFVFCENKILNDSGVMNEGEVSFRLGLPGISKIGEISEVAKVVQMSIHYEVPTLFQALSTKKSIELINDGKKSFKDLYAEVSIHHLCLDERACDGFNTYAKLNPPLRSPEDKEELLEMLKEGKIDTLTALHSPKSILFKDVAFAEAKYGIDTIENYLSICYTYLVKGGHIEWGKLVELISKKPAEILEDTHNGVIKEGNSSDIVLFDPKYSFKVKQQHSPYFGETLYGKILHIKE